MNGAINCCRPSENTLTVVRVGQSRVSDCLHGGMSIAVFSFFFEEFFQFQSLSRQYRCRGFSQNSATTFNRSAVHRRRCWSFHIHSDCTPRCCSACRCGFDMLDHRQHSLETIVLEYGLVCFVCFRSG